MQNAFSILQIDHILAIAETYAKTEIGKGRIKNLQSLDEEALRFELGRLTSFKKAKDQVGGFSICDSKDLSERYEFAKKGGTLDDNDFAAILSDLNCLEDIKKQFAKVSGEDELAAIYLNLDDCEPVRQGIFRVYDPSFNIRDNASTELKRLRANIAHKKAEITSKLNAALQSNKNYLSSPSFALRNGHYVLPVSATYKNVVKGIVHDVSSSGSTTFIEPESVVEAYNEIAILEAEEKEEIRRIKANLSRIAASRVSQLVDINLAIADLDFHNAKILYGEALRGHIADISDDGSLFIPMARHPLLDQSKVVPNTFALSEKRRILILSGPNAGGKTVAMKTLGTLSIMFAMGLFIPCAAGAMIPVFEHVYVDIGDSQSILDNLSTFSGHITHIGEILKVVKKGDLVLLDEVGTGTSPREGESIALAVVDKLRKSNCHALLSSHFESLKEVALSSDEIENASLQFDEKTLTPTYALRIGVPGESYGLEVAERLGLDEETLDSAKRYLSSRDDLDVAKSLKHLDELTALEEEKIALLQEKEAEIARILKENEILNKELKRKRESFESDAKEELQKLKEDYRLKADEAISSLSNPDKKLHEAIKAKKDLEAIDSPLEEELKGDADIKEGDFVIDVELGLSGRVKRIAKDRATIVSGDGMKFETSLSRLKHSEPEAKKARYESKKDVDRVAIRASLPLEVNLIGLHVDEALAELDRYLDQCRRVGYKRVRVVHGFGSGALRKACHNYFKTHSFIDKYEMAGEHEGAGGATVVYLK